MQLVIGDFGLSLDQQRAQMAVWAIFTAVSQLLVITVSVLNIFIFSMPKNLSSIGIAIT